MTVRDFGTPVLACDFAIAGMQAMVCFLGKATERALPNGMQPVVAAALRRAMRHPRALMLSDGALSKTRIQGTALENPEMLLLLRATHWVGVMGELGNGMNGL